MREILSVAAEWARSGVPFALATLVGVRGSSPRELGASMVVSADGRAFGNVSGGCVEGAVFTECLDAIGTDSPSLHTYGIDGDDIAAIGLTCGGIVEVLVRPVPPRSPAARALLLAAEREAAGLPVALALVTATRQAGGVVPRGSGRSRPPAGAGAVAAIPGADVSEPAEQAVPPGHRVGVSESAVGVAPPAHRGGASGSGEAVPPVRREGGFGPGEGAASVCGGAFGSVGIGPSVARGGASDPVGIAASVRGGAFEPEDAVLLVDGGGAPGPAGVVPSVDRGGAFEPVGDASAAMSPGDLIVLTDDIPPTKDRVAAETTALLGGNGAALLHLDSAGCRVSATEADLSLLVIPLGAAARLIVVGAVEFSVALARLGRVLGFAVTVVDPRDVFASAERFPEAEVVVDWPDRYLAATRVDARTAICVLSHDARFDVPALRVALASPAGYVGAMGSRRTHDDRLRRLSEARVAASDIARLRSPIGLDLGGRSPDETALSILAEIVALRHGATGRPHSELTGAVHDPARAAAVQPSS